MTLKPETMPGSTPARPPDQPNSKLITADPA